MASLVRRPDSPVYYIQFYLNRKLQRLSTGTESLQVAKEKLRQFESAQVRGVTLPFPTRTPIADVLSAYVNHVRTTKTPKSAQTNIYYLREAFGPVCKEIEVVSRVVTPAMKKRKPIPGVDGRRRASVIEANCFEQITTAQVSAFITDRVRAKGLSPKTANHYRQILATMFNWAMKQHGLRLPNDINPAAGVKRMREPAPTIGFLTLEQIDEQLRALKRDRVMRTIVATFIYAGLRREELVWLTREDLDLAHGNYGLLRIRAKTIDGQFWQPKTRTNRAVPVSKALRRYLDVYLKKHHHPVWLFASPDGNRWDTDNLSRAMRSSNERAGLDWTNLDYRHTFGSQLAMKGESLYKIATLMGNSPEICRRHYAALAPEALADSVEFPKLVKADAPVLPTNGITNSP